MLVADGLYELGVGTSGTMTSESAGNVHRSSGTNFNSSIQGQHYIMMMLAADGLHELNVLSICGDDRCTAATHPEQMVQVLHSNTR